MVARRAALARSIRFQADLQWLCSICPAAAWHGGGGGVLCGVVASGALIALVEAGLASMQALHHGDVVMGFIPFLLVWLTAMEFERSCGSISEDLLQPGSFPWPEMVRA